MTHQKIYLYFFKEDISNNYI